MKKIKMSNKAYDIVKIIIFLIGPVVALITGLGELYKFDSTLTVETITLIGTFLSAITGISTMNYNKEQFINDRLPTATEEEMKEEIPNE